jgi:hypothetical protein
LALAVAVILLAGQTLAQAESKRGAAAALLLPIEGTVAGGGTFSGTFSLQRFASGSGGIVAVGLITGTVTGGPSGQVTVLTGPVNLPVQNIKEGAAVSGLAPASGTRLARDGGRPRLGADIVLVQNPQTCGVLHFELGATTINVLGLAVTTSPIVFDISGQSGGTNVLGSLVCQILATLGNVVNLLGLLNQLLGVLGGLTGGLGA